MRRADRLFQLIQLIRGRRLTTAAHLAARLEVLLRTVYRDVANLLRQGVPIEGEAGIGYRLGTGFGLPPLMFSQDRGVRFPEPYARPGCVQERRERCQAKWSNERKTLGTVQPAPLTRRRPGSMSIWPIRVTAVWLARAAAATPTRLEGGAVNSNS